MYLYLIECNFDGSIVLSEIIFGLMKLDYTRQNSRCLHVINAHDKTEIAEFPVYQQRENANNNLSLSMRNDTRLIFILRILNSKSDSH